MTPRQALDRLGSAARGLRLLRPVHSAATKRSYLLAWREERFILRIDEPLAQEWRLDRRAEVDVLRRAAQAGVGPEVVAFEARAPAVLLLRYVPGRAWRRADLDDRRRLVQLAGLLRRVHAIAMPGPPLDLARAARVYAARADQPGASHVAAEVARLLRRLPPPQATLCHHDPITANVIGLSEPRLVDWEYAGAGAPWFDLAVVLAHHRVPRRQATLFLSEYFGTTAAIPGEAITTFRMVYDRILLLWLWAMQRTHPLSRLQQAWLREAGRAAGAGVNERRGRRPRP